VRLPRSTRVSRQVAARRESADKVIQKSMGLKYEPSSEPLAATRYRGVDTCPPPRHGTLQGYLAHKKHPPQDPTVGLCLGPHGGPRWGGRFLMSEVPLYAHHGALGGGAVSYERGTPVRSVPAPACEPWRSFLQGLADMVSAQKVIRLITGIS